MTGPERSPRPVLLVNGFGKFPLAGAAASLHQLGVPVELVTGAYPRRDRTGLVRRVVDRSAALRRWSDRREELPAVRVHSSLLGEAANQVGVRLARTARWHGAGRALEAFALRLSARRASRVLEAATRVAVYHVRSGYGGASLARARARGATVLVDHSIAHPRVLPLLVDNAGQLPAGQQLPVPPDAVWRRVDDDIETADHLVLNSDFVLTTFVSAGVDPARMSVVYQGVEDDVIAATAAALDRRVSEGPLRILFAGTVEQRKGALTILEALDHPDWDPSWQLELVGPWAAPLKEARAELARRHSKVVATAALDRLGLARRMLSADVFLFPSWAEGSARVVGMAMAAGCCCVVTSNSGSFLRDGQHGLLVPPGDAPAVVRQLRRLDDDRDLAWRLGHEAALLVRSDYRYSSFGRRLAALYDRL